MTSLRGKQGRHGCCHPFSLSLLLITVPGTGAHPQAPSMSRLTLSKRPLCSLIFAYRKHQPQRGLPMCSHGRLSKVSVSLKTPEPLLSEHRQPGTLLGSEQLCPVKTASPSLIHEYQALRNTPGHQQQSNHGKRQSWARKS